MTGLNPANEQRSPGTAASALAIELVGINKHFGPVHANRDIHLAIKRGTVHGIVGENGAGKSTLMSILYGFYTADSGTIMVDGVEHKITDSRHALALGIGMVHQHFMLVDNFTVLENVVLGAEDSALLRPTLNRARDHLKQLARDYGLEIDPDAVVENLSVGQQQRVEILKALYRGAETLILDEPTGVLTPAEADHLFRILGKLRAEGKTIILITHKLREIMAITDEVSVMRQGEMVATLATAQTSPEQLAELMVGRRVLLRVEKGAATPGAVLLEVENLVVTDDFGVPRVKSVNFQVRSGEIVGIAGVAGNGQSELLEAIAGMRDQQSGEVRVKGKALSLEGDDGAARARAAGLAHVPEDRLRMGLVTNFSAWENTILGYQDQYGAGPGLDIAKARASASEYMKKFDVRPANLDLKTSNFSGGNQQKLVLAREMERDPDVLIVGQPTRGVDIGAIEFIHNQIIKMRDAGKAILLVSVELDEIRSLSDRILVIFDGQIVGEADPATADETELGLRMTGSHKDHVVTEPGTLPEHETPIQQTLVQMSPKDNSGRDTN
ncbi:ABC transporter ATP-binding protein [Devosia sp. XJ19-1]|uniref:ABC transporter ATP-binding protein n=1 Tax=Devosia ureilytica TaxID=2952754 RepID=A0A9Q4FUN6_9HYPH|nr:ABC transporter ATP-binding protein [Devosia ureilytica]MCP8885272.1 ABC transporter ATP-binding protein [Devosia ureilytica]MCP8888730.1 ABC transporter ATP-binding protein [Devosia ureilytica]